MRTLMGVSFFFNDTATTEIYTLSLHDALPISRRRLAPVRRARREADPAHAGPLARGGARPGGQAHPAGGRRAPPRSEEHTSELQSRQYLVCRLLLEKNKHTHSRGVRVPHAAHL